VPPAGPVADPARGTGWFKKPGRYASLGFLSISTWPVVGLMRASDWIRESSEPLIATATPYSPSMPQTVGVKNSMSGMRPRGAPPSSVTTTSSAGA
jgi:hypothetical protein